MTCLNSSPVVLADLLDIVDTALATVSRRLPTHVGRDDLGSVGKLALVQALGQVNGSEEEVRAYCFVRVRGAMLDELRRLDALSRNRRARVKTVARAQTALASRLGREATLDELAAETQLPIPLLMSALSMCAAEPEEAELEWGALPDTESPSPVELTEKTDLQSLLRAALDRLPSNQAMALRLYYLEDASLDVIAAQLGVSRERARQVREAGEKRLRADFVVLALWQALLSRD